MRGLFSKLLKCDSPKVRTQNGFVHYYVTSLIEDAQKTSDVQTETHILSAQVTEYRERVRFTWKFSEFKGYIAHNG